MKLSGSAEAKRRQRRNGSGGGPEGVRDKVPNKSHSRHKMISPFRVVFSLIATGMRQARNAVPNAHPTNPASYNACSFFCALKKWIFAKGRTKNKKIKSND